MSFEIQQRKFVSFFVCLNLAGGWKEKAQPICWSDFISALVCEEQVAGCVCVHLQLCKLHVMKNCFMYA